MTDADPMQIECLACGDVRAVLGTSLAETGRCLRCGYLGWTYSDELDSTTRRMVMRGERLPRSMPLRARPDSAVI